MVDEDSPFAGRDLRVVIRMSDTDLAAMVRPPEAEIAAAIRRQAFQYIREGADVWPTTTRRTPEITPRALLAFRARTGRSQAWVGLHVGVTMQMVSKWERKVRPIPAEMQARLAALIAGEEGGEA